jgi:hypothetical protein
MRRVVGCMIAPGRRVLQPGVVWRVPLSRRRCRTMAIARRARPAVVPGWSTPLIEWVWVDRFRAVAA